MDVFGEPVLLKVLLVGGSRNGEEVEVAELRRWLKFIKKEPLPIVVRPWPPEMTERLHALEEYRLERYRFRDGPTGGRHDAGRTSS